MAARLHLRAGGHVADSGSRGTTRRGRGYTRARAHAGAGVVVAVVRERLLRGGVAGLEPAGGARLGRGRRTSRARRFLARIWAIWGVLLTDASGERRFLALDSSTLAAAAAASLRKRPVDMGSGSSSGSDARAFARSRGPTDAGPVNHEPSGVLYAPPPAKSGVIIPPGHSLLAIHEESGVVTCCVPRRVPTHCGVAARGVPAGTLGAWRRRGATRGCRNPGRASRASHWEPARAEGETRGSTLGSRSVEARRVKTSRESYVSRRRAQGREGGTRLALRLGRRALVGARSGGFRRGRGHAVRSPRVSPSDARRTMAPPSAGCVMKLRARNFSDVPVVTVTSRMFRDGGTGRGRAHSRARAGSALTPPHSAMIASIPGRDARDGPMDLSYAAAERDSAPHLIPQGKVSNLTAKRLRAEIRARIGARRPCPTSVASPRNSRPRAWGTRQLARGEGLHGRQPRSRTSRALLPARRRRCARESDGNQRASALTVPDHPSPDLPLPPPTASSQATGRRASCLASPSTPRVPSVPATPPSPRSIAIGSSPARRTAAALAVARRDRGRTRRAE